MEEALLIIALVSAVLYFGKTKTGNKIFAYLPAPFWVYFLSILLGTFSVLPHRSPLYGALTLYILPMALFLLLVGTPIQSLFQIGPKALGAMGLATVSMFGGVVVSFLLTHQFLPNEGWKMAATMLGTWTGGSANMAAVKEVVSLSDAGMAPLILIDTFLSYGWLALLVTGAGFQVWFDKKMGKTKIQNRKTKKKTQLTWFGGVPVVMTSFVVVYGVMILSAPISAFFSVLSQKAWIILMTSTVAVLLSMTPLRALEQKGASPIGTFFLYCVLATYGAKTSFSNIGGVLPFFAFGLIALVIHGTVLFAGGRLFKIPMFLLATASQANIGGPVSAPIVAGTYKPGGTHFGVLMAILGAVFGTYIGVFGGWICGFITK